MLNFDWLNNIPDSTAKYIILLAFVVPLIFAFSLKKKYIYAGAEDNSLWRNLKLWVLALSSIMIALYLYF